MGKLKLYDTSMPPEQVLREREEVYLALSPKEKFLQLISLIHLSVALNGGQPLKQPQRKGLVISRNNISWYMALETGSEEMLLLLKTFEKLNVSYLIVGGFAVNRYGYKRTTGDLDIYLKDTPENRAKLIEALDAMGYGRFDMLMEVPIIAGYCEVMMDDGIYADLMTDIPGLDKDKFDLYYKMATVDKIDNYVIRFLHYNHLLQNKEATGRTKDLLDIAELKRINEGKL